MPSPSSTPSSAWPSISAAESPSCPSGPAIRPIALRMVWEVAQAVTLPIIGIGGIMTGDDAVEFLLAGASAVQVGTANFLDPSAPLKVLAGIESYLARHSFDSVAP